MGSVMNPFEGDYASNDAGVDLGTQVDFSFLDYTHGDDSFEDYPKLDLQVLNI